MELLKLTLCMGILCLKFSRLEFALFEKSLVQESWWQCFAHPSFPHNLPFFGNTLSPLLQKIFIPAFLFESKSIFNVLYEHKQNVLHWHECFTRLSQLKSLFWIIYQPQLLKSVRFTGYNYIYNIRVGVVSVIYNLSPSAGVWIYLIPPGPLCCRINITRAAIVIGMQCK